MSKGGWYEDKWVKCPFYFKESAHALICEAPDEFGDLRARLLLTPKQKARHKQRCCALHYAQCDVYRAAMAKYEKEQG